MGHDSIISLLILLAVFFIVPYILKYLGQYTLGSRQRPEETPPQGHEYEDDAQRLDEPLDNVEIHQDTEDYERMTRKSAIQNKPIKPRWF